MMISYNENERVVSPTANHRQPPSTFNNYLKQKQLITISRNYLKHYKDEQKK